MFIDQNSMGAADRLYKLVKKCKVQEVRSRVLPDFKHPMFVMPAIVDDTPFEIDRGELNQNIN